MAATPSNPWSNHSLVTSEISDDAGKELNDNSVGPEAEVGRRLTVGDSEASQASVENGGSFVSGTFVDVSLSNQTVAHHAPSSNNVDTCEMGSAIRKALSR